MRILKICMIFGLIQFYGCKYYRIQKSKTNFSLVRILSTYKEGILDKYDLSAVEKKYKNASLFINDSLLFLNYNKVKDTFYIGKQFSLDSVVDNEQTKRYVGDEILCLNNKNKIVGKTLLNMLNIKYNKLFYNDLICVNHTYTCVKMIQIDSINKAIFFQNDFYILVFKKQ